MNTFSTYLEDFDLKRFKSICIVDTSWQFYRFHYAFKRLLVKVPSGEVVSTGVFYGLTLLCETLYRQGYDLILFALDCGDGGRSELESGYKGGRKSSIDFSWHTSFAIPLLSVLPKVSFLVKKGYEADDIIASFVLFSQGVKDLEIDICGIDKDLQQLACYSNVRVFSKFNKRKPEFIEVSEPCKIPFLKTIVGDSSDNLKPIVKLSGVQKELLTSEWFNCFKSSSGSQFDLSTSLKEALRKCKIQLSEEEEVAGLIERFGIVDLLHTFCFIEKTILFKSGGDSSIIDYFHLNKFKNFLRKLELLG